MSKEVPLYRLYNPNSTKHHYTVDENEYNILGNAGWTKEGVSCMVRSSVTDNSTVYYFPEGVHTFTGKLTFQKGVSIRGAGMDRTILRFTGTGSGIQVFPEIGGGNTSIKDLTIEHITDGLADAPAITVNFLKQIQGGIVMPRTTPRLTIKDVHIKGQWQNGIVLTDANHSTIQNVTITGHVVNGNQTHSGIVLMGEASGTEIQIKDSWVYHCNTGISIHGSTEGVVCDGLTLVSVHSGISWTSSTNKPHLSLSNSHINSRDFGVRTNGVHQTIIRGNLFYKYGPATYVGIKHSNSDDHIITGNIFKSQGTNSTTSIHFNNCGDIIVTNNILMSAESVTGLRGSKIYNGNIIK